MMKLIQIGLIYFTTIGYSFLTDDKLCGQHYGHCQSQHEVCLGHHISNLCPHSHHAVCCIPTHTTCPTNRELPDKQPVTNNSYSCGINHGTVPLLLRIMGGHPSYPGQWPWQVIITENGKFACAGVIINDRWILTVAHCVDTQVSAKMHMEWKYKVITGEHDLSQAEDSEHTVNVSQIVHHPHFWAITTANDIALVKVSDAIKFNRFVRPVCLPEPEDNFEGRNCRVLGWGETRGTGDPNILQWVGIPVISNSECQRRFSAHGHSRDPKILPTNICAGERGKDSCKGDSGGPLICLKNDRSWVVAGIVSWGDACGDGDHPGVYTRVQCYADWISATINS